MRGLVAAPLALLVGLSGVAFVGLVTVAVEISRPSTASADPVTPGIFTLAGSGASGFVDGGATSASFVRLASIAVDPSGDWLYAIDTELFGNQPHIRKISTSTGEVTTFAVGGMLSSPQYVAVDAAGDVWVSVYLSSTGAACDGDGLSNDPERGIIKYPASGGQPTVMVSGLGCDYYNNTDHVAGAFGFDATGQNLFFVNVRGTDNGYTTQSWLPNIRSVPLSALPVDDGYVPGTTQRPAAHSVTDWGGRGTVTRGGLADLDVGADGEVYALWGGTDEGTGTGSNLYRLDAPGSLTLVIPGRVTAGEHEFAFSTTTSSTYSICSGPAGGNGCSGTAIVRRSGFGSGEPFHLAGGVQGYADGYPGQLNVYHREEAGVALSPDGARLYVADAVNRRIRVVDIPPDPNPLSPSELLCGCNAGEKNLHSPLAGDPVSVATGSLTEAFTDVSVAGRGVPLRVSRTYNSARADQIGLFGRGWDSNLDARLVRSGSEVVIEQENGATLPFSKTATGGWAGPPRVTSTLTEEGDGSWTLIRDKRDIVTFDSNGRLSGFKDPNGYVTAVSYPSSSSIVVTDPGGRTLTLTLNGSGRVISVADSTRPGRTIGYGYASDQLTSVSSFNMNDDDATPVSWSYAYDAVSQRLESITNPRGHSNFTHYDASGRVDYQLDFAGSRMDFAYGGTAPDTWTEVTHPANNATGTRPVERYEFSNLLMTSRTTAYGTAGARTWTYEYDPNLMAVIAVKAPGGALVSATDYDPATGNVIRMEDGLGRVTTITYNAFNDPLTTLTPDGVTTTNTYDANGNLLTSATPIKVGTAAAEAIATTTFVRSDTSHPDDVIELIEPRQDGTTFSTDFTYDAASGLPSQVTDAEGKVTKFEHDASGHLTRVIDPLGTSSGSPSNHDILFEVNDFGLIEETIDQLGHVTSYRYDKSGHRTLTTDPQESVGTVYDQMGRVTRVDRPGGSHLDTTYFDDGSVKAQIDAAGAQTTYKYNLHGEVTTITDPLGRATSYGHDARGRTTSLIAPGGSCPSTLCTTYGYNNADELTSVLYSDPLTPDVTYAYDPVNMRKTMTDGAGTSTWQWDSLGRLRSFTDPVTGPVTYGYTDAGQPDEGPTARSVTYATGKTVTRTVDDTGRLETLSGWMGGTTSFAYDDNGNLDTIDTAATSGVEDDYAYDATNSMTSATFKQAANVLATLGWTRDPEGMVDTVTGTAALDNADDDYGHSSLDMLSSDIVGAFAYDPADNLNQLPDGRQQKFNPANELCYQAATSTAGCGSAPADATTYGYDGRGNRTTEVDPDGFGKSLSYDQADRLTAVEAGTVSVAPLDEMDGQAIPGDYDGDGKTDVFWYRPGTGTDHVTWGAPRSTFGKEASSFTVQNTYTPASGDFDGDGKDDILWYRSTGTDTIWFWDGRTIEASVPITITYEYDPIVGDFDADGYDDIFLYQAGSGADTIWWGRADVDDGHGFDVTHPTVNGTYQPFAGDFDGNGTDDVFWYGPGATADSIWWFSPTTRGAYTGTTRAVTLNYLTFSGDFDGDGRDDAGFHNWGGTDYMWWGHSVPASFGAASQALPEIDDWRVPFAGDFNGDGYDDMMPYQPGNPQTVWWGSPTRTAFGADLALVGLPTPGPTTTYTYTGDGLRRTKTSADGTVTKYTWDRSGALPLLIAEAITAPGTSGDRTVRYLYGPTGHVVADITTPASGAETVRWYHHDQLGSTVALTNNTGAVIGTYDYSPFGETVATTGTATTPIGWAGEYRDEETGYTYLRARYYDPATAQFLTRDPLEATTRSAYGYVSNNPINHTDPTGLCCSIPDFVPVVGGKCIDLNDPDCESDGDHFVEDVRRGAGIVKDYVEDDIREDWVGPITFRKVLRNVASYSAGVVSAIGCGVATAPLSAGASIPICAVAGYALKQATEAAVDACLDATGRIDVDTPISWELEW